MAADSRAAARGAAARRGYARRVMPHARATPAPAEACDAVLLVAFGGPEGPGEVMPFLERVTRGRNVPRSRLEQVAEHYALLGGVSPLNAQLRALAAALRRELELELHGMPLPVYVGNRNWHPLLADTVQEMATDGVERAYAFFTSPYSSYPGCRQYRENLEEARRLVGPSAPEIAKLRGYYNHPGWVTANADHLRDALGRAGAGPIHVAFTAHSIPEAVASRCRYEHELRESCRLVAGAVGIDDFALVYQSRSGPPEVAWLEPDVLEHLRAVREGGAKTAVLMPIGFVSDHVEVVYDLDIEARAVAQQLGLELVRASSASTHPAFVAMIRELIQERLDPALPRRTAGRHGPRPDVCAAGCCLPGTRPSPDRSRLTATRARPAR